MIPWYVIIIYPAKWSKRVAHWKLKSITSLLFAMIIQSCKKISWAPYPFPTPPQTCWVASVGPEVKMLQKFFLRSLCKSLRITLALQVSRNKNHFTSLSAVDVRVRSEQWAGKAQWLDAQTLGIRVVFIHQVQALCSNVPTKTNTHTAAGPSPLLLLCLRGLLPEQHWETIPYFTRVCFLGMGHPVSFLTVRVYILRESHSES